MGRNPTSPTSLYVHVPFCAVKCGYCDFNSFVDAAPAAHDRFLRALERELELARITPNPPSVFIGGGTPTYIDAARLERLMQILARFVDLPGCPEVTMEANPESVSREKAEIVRSCGVRRISMGVQTFDPERLKFLDRPHDARRVRDAVSEIRAAGVDNLSLDLIFGLPGQSLEEWEADLRQAVELRPNHLSCYNLTYEPGTRMYRDLQQGRLRRNDDDSDLAMFLRTREVLWAAGFTPYEISNFAGDGGPCHHNDHYWRQGDYVGVGPGACSHRTGVRVTNLKALESWAAAVEAGSLPTATAEALTPRQRAGEALWLGLRRVEGICMSALEQRLDYPLTEVFGDRIGRHQQAGLLSCDQTTVRLTDRGVLVADSIGADFLG